MFENGGCRSIKFLNMTNSNNHTITVDQNMEEEFFPGVKEGVLPKI